MENKLQKLINKLQQSLSPLFSERDGSVAVEYVLPKGRWVSLRVDGSGDDKGLLCSYNDDGSYDIHYWYGDVENVVNFELEADGDSVGENVRAISIVIDEDKE